MKRQPPPAHMLTGSYFYEPVAAWIASGTFRHTPEPFGRDEVSAREQAARGRQTALANGITGTVQIQRGKRAIAKPALAIFRTGKAEPGGKTFSCAQCGGMKSLTGSKMRAKGRTCMGCVL